MKLIDYVNKHIQEIPPEVESWAVSPSLYNNPCYCSVIRKNCGQIYEAIYGVKRIKGKTYIQLLVVDAEKDGRYVRNCYYSWYGCSKGFHSYGYTGKGVKCSYYYELDYETILGEAKDDSDTDKIHRVCLNASDLSTLEPNLRYCAYRQDFIEPMTYLRIYRRYPKQAEMLMKFGLTRMISESNCKRLSENPMFHRWLERHHEQCRYMAYQTAFNSYKKNPECDPRDYENSLCYRIQCAKELVQRNKPVYDKAMKHTTPERLVQWQEKNKVSPASYMDYLVACDWLRLDFSDTKVLFPRNFKEMHDIYTEQYGAHQAELRRQERLAEERRIAEQDKADAEERKTRAQRMLDVSTRFSFLAYRSNGYLAIVARDVEELISEGSALHHCVGRMNYDKRMASGSEVICFIRKENEPDKPFVTAQVMVGSSLKLNQCYGYNDRKFPEVDEFTENWMAYANRRYKDAV